jgi:Skp family chaperone for outer membrane proteins
VNVKKRLFSLLLGTLVLGPVIMLATHGTAQTPAPGAGTPAPQPTTKIAVLNLSYVVKNYQKFVRFSAEMKSVMQNYEMRVKGKQATLESLAKEIKDKGPGISAPDRDRLEKALVQANRELEDITKEGKTYLTKRNDEQLVVLYREVQDTAIRYAQARGYEMVLHFNDALASSPEYYSVSNVARKIQAGALIPLFVNPSLDISYQVVQTLNQADQRTQGSQPGTNGTPGTTGTPAGGGTPARTGM